MLFDYGHMSEVYEALMDGIKTVEIENWLQVRREREREERE